MQPPQVRSSIVSDYAPFARERGLDPVAMIRAAGLPLRCLTQPEMRLRVRKVNRLLERSAAASGTPDFGLQLSRTRRLSSLGVLGALMRDEQTVRAAMRRSIASAHLNSNAIWMQLDESQGSALLRVSIEPDGEPVIRQGTEMALGGVFRILQHLIASAWKPRAVYFMHEPASTAQTYRRFFGCPVSFAADFNGIVIDSSDLDRPIPLSDERLRRYATHAIGRHIPQERQITAHAVKQQIMLLLSDGMCSSDMVAASLGVDRRTIHRHLSREGTSFSSLADSVRLELAYQYIRAGRLDCSSMAEILGFSSLSSFSRWFRAESGMPPSAWRRKNCGAKLPYGTSG